MLKKINKPTFKDVTHDDLRKADDEESRGLVATALEFKFHCLIPGGANHARAGKEGEEFLKKHPKKKPREVE